MKIIIALSLLLTVNNVYAVCDENAAKLIKSYPLHLRACEDNYIIWHDGHQQLYDDGQDKTFRQLLDQPDIEDMFTFSYPTGQGSYSNPLFNNDPGRIRNEEFFKYIYGRTKKAVKKNLVAIQWMPKYSGKKTYISQTNSIDKKLIQIANELDVLPKALRKYVIKTSGTYNWRVISGTKRLSAHSFAIAIDIDAKQANYWKWSGKNYQYQNTIPYEIVEIFEKNGFIWGGKWYHYDTMHFEYRPELLPYY